MIVFAFGTSRPDWMMAEAIKTSASRLTNFNITASSSAAFIWPCAITMWASGTSPRSHAPICSIVSTRLCTKYTCPLRLSSRRITSRTTLSLARITSVLIANLPAGGVSMMERSRTLDMAICNVRGMGVAVSVSTSTSVRSCLSRSLCLTPNHCSSSMMTNPR